jgi:hypothetical protein
MAEGVVAGHCGICGFEFPDPAVESTQPADTPCPKCGGHSPVFVVSASDSCKFHEFIEAKGKRLGEKKPYIETQAGDQRSTARARLVDKYRRIDRDRDLCDEVITDPESGEIIYECHELLSEHWGRGSAKTRQARPPEG